MTDEMINKAWQEFQQGKDIPLIIKENGWNVTAPQLRQKMRSRFGRDMQSVRVKKQLLFVSRRLKYADMSNLSDEEIDVIMSNVQAFLVDIEVEKNKRNSDG